MARYIVKRVLIMIPILIGVTILVYCLASAAPGSPVDMLMGDMASMTEESIAAMEERLGLDQPVYVQYWKWLTNMLSGNMGTSYRTGEPVWTLISQRIGPTLILTGSALLLAIIVSTLLGTLAAYKPYSVCDYLSSGLSFIGAAMPNFFVCLVLIFIFAVTLGWLPVSGMYDTLSDRNFGSLIRHLIMPCCVLALQLMGGFLRQMRSSMIESLGDDYINTARSKGLKERTVVFKHSLRNSLIPMVSQIGLSLPLLVGGAVVTEQIFSWPGLGSLLVLSINARDYPTIMGITVIIAAVVLVGNLIVDLLYGVLDPRIRYD